MGKRVRGRLWKYSLEENPWERETAPKVKGTVGLGTQDLALRPEQSGRPKEGAWPAET